MARLGRPRAKKVNVVNVRLTEREYDDLRAAAVLEDCTMADVLRRLLHNKVKTLKAAGKWTGETEREGGEEPIDSKLQRIRRTAKKIGLSIRKNRTTGLYFALDGAAVVHQQTTLDDMEEWLNDTTRERESDIPRGI